MATEENRPTNIQFTCTFYFLKGPKKLLIKKQPAPWDNREQAARGVIKGTMFWNRSEYGSSAMGFWGRILTATLFYNIFQVITFQK
jgi:hypothetical protein